ncbi:MAG: iron complex outermembrane receptor protein [Planctomycetota bacterium]|jgi:iron complex outermembrane receptor protein
MVTFQSINNQTTFVVFLTLVSIIFLRPTTVLAQEDHALVLEEIIVTAQRREQNLKEVPISIEVFGGREIRQQGFRDIDDLANFSPTVLILPRVQDQDVSIRGFGTTGNALTLDQAAPTFVDGIHFGRSSQSRMAFMDLQSVEVLKGPQPVYFGQNATAGAFNIRSRRPSDSWEANVDVEYGENETAAVDIGVGGPLSDTLGIRVAGKYDTTDGYLKDVVTQRMLGDYENIGGRVVLQWAPTNALQVTAKIESSRLRKDTETTHICRVPGLLIFGRDGPTDNPGEAPGDERSIWGEPDIDPITGLNSGGAGWSESFKPLGKCFDSDDGISNGGPYSAPPDNIREENSDRGVLDIREAAEAFTRGDRNKSTQGYEDVDADNGYVELAYEFSNGIKAEWLGGWSYYNRDYALDNTNTPFLINLQARGEEFEQLSSEIRFTSPGDGPIEWMAGAYWQDTELFAWSSSLRANVRQGQRYNVITEDVDYKSLFATMTFNFMDDKMSIDLGGRYAHVEKDMTVVASGASWVYDVEPVSAGDGGLPGCTEDDPIPCNYFLVDPATARIFLPVTPGASLWAMPFRQERDIPDEWLPSNALAVGLTAQDFNADGLGGPWDERLTANKFDPQITLRYRPTNNLSFYARYAKAFKIGGFDTGQASVPRDLDSLIFASENAETWELGAKGTLWDGRFGFDVSLFELRVPDLQTTTESTDPEQTTSTVNAGQRVRGLEFNFRMAATENLRFMLAGALMDGEMTKFPGGGCTDSEIAAAISDANAPCQIFDEDGVLQVPPIDSGDAFDDFLSVIDRSGAEAPRTPDWKFVLTADYRVPIAGMYELSFNAKGYVSDGYILDVESFSQTVKYNQHEDLNLTIGFGDIDGRWRVSLFGRNLLEARPSYNARFDTFPIGLGGAGDNTGTHLGPSQFRTFGLKFEYSLR